MDGGQFEFIGEVISASNQAPPSPTPAARPSIKVNQFPFPKPTTGRICSRCREIPVEIFLLGSSLLSNRCKARHAEGENCKGKHQITCHHCSNDIQGTHYHCGICNDDDLDICADCQGSGADCLQQEHKLVKRIFDEQLVREVSDDDESYHHPGMTRSMVDRGMEPYRLHNTLGELLASADAGCHSCSVLASRIDGLIEDASQDTPVFIENRPLITPPNIGYVNGMINMMSTEPDLDFAVDEGMPLTVLAVRTERDAENPIYVDPTKDQAVSFVPFQLRWGSRTLYSRRDEGINGRECRQIAPAVDAGENLKVIGSWLQACLNGSSECASWPREPFIPTRLLYIENESLRLVRGSDLAKLFPGYATLSYCWGVTKQESPWTLTRERLQQFEEKIPTVALPKTIADAIHVARVNGIDYLWVDSLCIVQDDADDWAYEAYRMGHVYNGSLFTIISGTDSATDGLFLPRHQLKVSAAEIAINTIKSESYRAILYPLLYGTDTMHHRGPTSKRAWCYQEELLSARRLYFTKGRFNWECLCGEHSEIGIKGPGDAKSREYSLPDYDVDVLLRRHSVVGEWRRIVEQYTSRQITYHTDVFAALAGIASFMKPRYKSRYLAGTWECTILDELLWHRVGSSLARPTEFEAPSWSWLSVMGPVIFSRGGHHTFSEQDAEYIGCDVQTGNGDEFGTVAPDGTLHLRARLLNCQVSAVIEEQDFERLENTCQEMPIEERPVPFVDEAEDSDSDGEADVDRPRYVTRYGPFEVVEPKPIFPPGGRLDMTARVRLSTGQNNLEFATVFFDGEEEAQTTTEFVVAYISATHRPADVVDRNGIALVPVATETGDKNGEILYYRRVGFVAFWDKIIGNDLQFMLKKEKTSILVV